MSLASGTKLGPYEVLSPLGAGRMGEVYRARWLALLNRPRRCIFRLIHRIHPGSPEFFENPTMEDGLVHF